MLRDAIHSNEYDGLKVHLMPAGWFMGLEDGYRHAAHIFGTCTISYRFSPGRESLNANQLWFGRGRCCRSTKYRKKGSCRKIDNTLSQFCHWGLPKTSSLQTPVAVTRMIWKTMSMTTFGKLPEEEISPVQRSIVQSLSEKVSWAVGFRV